MKEKEGQVGLTLEGTSYYPSEHRGRRGTKGVPDQLSQENVAPRELRVWRVLFRRIGDR